jgi:hypothetical protein
MSSGRVAVALERQRADAGLEARVHLVGFRVSGA